MATLRPILEEFNLATAIRTALLPTLLDAPRHPAQQTLTEWASSLEAALPGLEQALSSRVDELRVVSGHPFVIDLGVEWLADLLLQVEQSAASALELFRASGLARQISGTDLAALANRVDSALVQTCETLRDTRWELMALRAEASQASGHPPLSLAELRADLGLA